MPSSRYHVSRGKAHILYIMPIMTLIFGFFLLPLLYMIRMSFNRHIPGKIFAWDLTLENYQGLFSNPLHVNILLFTLLFGVLSAMSSTAIAYIIAYQIWTSTGRKRMLLLSLGVLPLFMSEVVISAGWLFSLATGSYVNFILRGLGILEARPLSYNLMAVLLATNYYVLPYEVLTLWSNLEMIDRRLLDIARVLGAGKLRSFFEVVLPLSVPGIITSLILGFIWSIGVYTIPATLGSPREHTLPIIIQTAVLFAFNWPYGAALSTVLLLCALIFIISISRTLTRYV